MLVDVVSSWEVAFAYTRADRDDRSVRVSENTGDEQRFVFIFFPFPSLPHALQRRPSWALTLTKDRPKPSPVASTYHPGTQEAKAGDQKSKASLGPHS